MPDIFTLLAKWWKQILVVVLLSIITAAVVLLLSPRKYLSVTTALPASSYNADKSRIFNENIQELYSVLGTADDLDMITGTGKLDTLYLHAVDQFNLAEHYKTSEKGETARYEASLILKKNTRILRSEYGELKVKVWDKDRNLAAHLANALMDKIQTIHQDLQSGSNMATLQSLESAKRDLEKHLDTITTNDTALKAQLSKYNSLIAEYQLMVNSRPPVLLIVERARPSQVADKPKALTVMLVTGFLSLLFGFLLALVLDKKSVRS